MYQHMHEIDENPKTNKHLDEIIDSISKRGWVGLPLLANGEQLLNGCHRATACQIIGVQPNVHQVEIKCTWGDSDYTDSLLDDFANASDALEVLRALKALLDEGMVDQYSVEIMKAECDKE